MDEFESAKNLLSKAIKDLEGKNGKIEIIQEQKNTDYILKIKDSGVGIDKKYHNKIFKKFVHIDNIYSKSQLFHSKHQHKS